MLTSEEIQKYISEDKSSEKKRLARKGQDYYEGKHDIRNYRLFYYDTDGVLREDKYRSNVKIPHPFFTELVDQAVQYIFSGEQFAKSELPELQEKLDEYFNYNENFTANISELLRGCMTKGFEYMYAYKDENDRLNFQCTDSLGVIEIRKNSTDSKPEYVIYYYTDRVDKNHKEIKRIQVWDDSLVWYYVQDEYGKIELDESEEMNPKPHNLYAKKDGKTYGKSFGFIPFFRIDNNKKQVSDLKIIKELIDDYDLMASSLSNNLIDFDMPLYAISGFEGDNLDELQTNLKSKKMIGLDEGGSVEVKTVDVPYQARLTKLELDEKNIYRFGMGLNTAGLKDTSATTNIAIKAAYSLLDLKCAKLETRLKQFLRKLVKPILDEINETEKTGYKQSDVWFEFKHEIMSNAQENAQIELTEAQAQSVKINTLLNLAEQLDNETLMQNICDALDIDYEKIKDKLPAPNDADEKLLDAESELGEDISESERQTQQAVLDMLENLLKELG